MKKKLLYIIENENNFFLIKQIEEIAKDFDLSIATSSEILKNKLNRRFKVYFLKKDLLEKIIEKICIILSSPQHSAKEKYYNQLAYKNTESVIKKFYLHFKLNLYFKNFLLRPYTLFQYLFPMFLIKKKYKFVNKFDGIIYDFRFFHAYNNCKSLILYANTLKKIK